MLPHKMAMRELLNSGYFLERRTGKHDIDYNAVNNSTIPLKRHNFDEDDLRYIRKEIRLNAHARND